MKELNVVLFASIWRLSRGLLLLRLVVQWISMWKVTMQIELIIDSIIIALGSSTMAVEKEWRGRKGPRRKKYDGRYRCLSMCVLSVGDKDRWRTRVTAETNDADSANVAPRCANALDRVMSVGITRWLQSSSVSLYHLQYRMREREKEREKHINIYAKRKKRRRKEPCIGLTTVSVFSLAPFLFFCHWVMNTKYD